MLPHPLVLLALALLLGACERQQRQAAQPERPSAVVAAVGDDPAVARLPVGSAARCPVTGEDFTIKPDTVQVTFAGKRYAFCCADCQPSFAKNPRKYAAR